MRANPIRSMLGLAVLLALAAVACGGAPATGGAPDVGDLAALDAQATLNAWNAIQTTAQAEALAATRVAEEATAASARQTSDAAAELATATAVSAQSTSDAAAQSTAVAQSTWDAIAVNKADAEARRAVAEGELALIVQATATIRAGDITATHDASVMAFMQREADIAIREREAEAVRAEMWNRLTPWIIGTVALTAVGLLFLVVGSYLLVRVRQSKPQQAGDTWVLYHPEGPRVIAQPQAAMPRFEPRAQLTAGPAVAVEEDRTPIALPQIRHGHALVAGETGSGKSTAMRAVLAPRPNVVVLDPHSSGSDWGAARVVGGGRDFNAIREYMSQMERMLAGRYEERASGRMEFDSHTVAVDEMPAIVAEIGRDIEGIWRSWLREGRKVGLYLVLATQSTRVRTLGIEGERDLLENFGVVLVLGDAARQEYPRLVEGMERPAVLHTRGKARPVVIPHVPEAQAAAAPPHSTLPPVYSTTEWPTRPRREETPIDLDNVDDRARQRIIDEYRRELVMRRVQLKLFPQYGDDGGRAFYVIREVLEQAGMIEPGPNGRYQPSRVALGLA